MKRSFIILAAIAMVAGQNFAQAGSRPTIVNGHDLQSHELSQMAMLSSMGSRCSATLIGPKVVLTAAHCIKIPNGVTQLRQSFGPINGQYHQANFEIHPRYTGNDNNIPFDMAMKYDLAIGILETAPADVKPVSVTSDAPALKEKVMYAGIGAPRVGVRQYGYAHAVTVSTIGMTIRGSGSSPQIGYPGDSGGPMFMERSNGSLVVAAVASTSTLDKDLSTHWPEALPYTEGLTRTFPDSFLSDFATRNNVDICGVNTTCEDVFFKSF